MDVVPAKGKSQQLPDFPKTQAPPAMCHNKKGRIQKGVRSVLHGSGNRPLMDLRRVDHTQIVDAAGLGPPTGLNGSGNSALQAEPADLTLQKRARNWRRLTEGGQDLSRTVWLLSADSSVRAPGASPHA